MRNLLFHRCIFVATSLQLVLVGQTFAQDRPPLSFRDAVGSWFGRALPAPGGTCSPGSAGCNVPPEIVMVFTINKDGTFIGIDSNIFTGGTHSTAHGQWTYSGDKSVKAAFTFLQSGPNGVFLGGFKNIFNATVIDADHMEGSIDAYFYQYTTPLGAVIVDGNGFPNPSPLTPPEQCATQPRCAPFGTFNFKVQRVSVPPTPTPK
jgi:hypothetical protein